MADGNISWGASRGSLDPIYRKKWGAVERYFAHNIKTSDIVLNEREGNFEENG